MLTRDWRKDTLSARFPVYSSTRVVLEPALVLPATMEIMEPPSCQQITAGNECICSYVCSL